MTLTRTETIKIRFSPVACFSAKLFTRQPGKGEVDITLNFLKEKGLLNDSCVITKNAFNQISKITSNGANITAKCIDCLMKG